MIYVFPGLKVLAGLGLICLLGAILVVVWILAKEEFRWLLARLLRQQPHFARIFGPWLGHGIHLRSYLGRDYESTSFPIPAPFLKDFLYQLQLLKSKSETITCLSPANPRSMFYELDCVWGTPQKARPSSQVELRPDEKFAFCPEIVVLEYEGVKLALYVPERTELELAYAVGGHESALQVMNLLERRAQEKSRFRGCLVSIGESGLKIDAVANQVEQPVLTEKLAQELDRSLLSFLRQRTSLSQLGLPTKRGLLLSGPPGTGKTSIVRWLVSQLPERVALQVNGENPDHLRQVFRMARILAPAVVVIEDIDLIAINRYQNRLSLFLGALMTEMDGIQSNCDVTVLMTSNDTSEMEAAMIRRPGRIDQIVEVPLPCAKARESILRSYCQRAGLEGEVGYAEIAQKTEGLSPAALRELFQQGVVRSLEHRRSLTTEDFLLGVPGLLQQVRDPHQRGKLGLRSA